MVDLIVFATVGIVLLANLRAGFPAALGLSAILAAAIGIGLWQDDRRVLIAALGVWAAIVLLATVLSRRLGRPGTISRAAGAGLGLLQGAVAIVIVAGGAQTHDMMAASALPSARAYPAIHAAGRRIEHDLLSYPSPAGPEEDARAPARPPPPSPGPRRGPGTAPSCGSSTAPSAPPNARRSASRSMARSRASRSRSATISPEAMFWRR
ncbi:hypothetical protein PARU111607_09320 [Palleronia rufa]